MIKLKTKIARLEESQGEAPSKADEGGGPQGARTPFEVDLLLQRGRALVNIQGIQNEIARLRSEIAAYQQRVENTPKREQELLSLKRDYENMQETYSSFLARKLEADIAVNMEKKQKGEQLRIMDPPRRPFKPISPDLRVIFLGCLVLGLGAGGGLLFLLEFMDDSVKKPETFHKRMDIPVLVVFPDIETPQKRLLRRLNNGFSLGAVAVSLILLICLASVTVADIPFIADRLRALPLIG